MNDCSMTGLFEWLIVVQYGWIMNAPIVEPMNCIPIIPNLFNLVSWLSPFVITIWLFNIARENHHF